MTARLAWRLAFSSDVRQRWRQVSVIAAVFIATAMMLLAAGVVHAAAVSDARILGRSPLWAQTQDDARLRISARGLVMDGRQFPVVWLEPAPGHENDPDIVPPGLTRLPAPGEAVLSPGLAHQGLTARDFGLRPSTAGNGPDGTIGATGLSTSSEGFLYVRPTPGRTLGTGGALLLLRGYTGRGEKADLETFPELPSLQAALVGVTWLLLGPSLILMLGAARAMSRVRDERARTLWRLGVTPARVRSLLAIETMFLALTGALPALLGWFLAGAHLRSLPLTRTTLLPGALHLPWWAPPLVTAAVLGATVLGAVVGRIAGRTLARDSRTIRPWHAVPLATAFLMMIVTQWLPWESPARPYLLFGGLLLTFAALPAGLPVLVARTAGLLGRARHPAIWLAGRRLALRTANLSRPAAAVGVLVFVAGAAFALYARLIEVEPNATADVPLTRFIVNWRDARQGDLTLVRQELSQLHVAPLIGENTAMFTSCDDLTQAITPLALHPCGLDGRLDDQFINQFSRLTGTTPQIGPHPPQAVSGVLLLSGEDLSERDIMQALAGSFPAVNITRIPGTKLTAAAGLPAWTIAGWVIATLILMTALLREIGDRALTALQDDGQLTRLGLTQEEIDRIHRWTLLPPIALAIPIGLVGAIAFALIGYQLGFTVAYLNRISVVALTAGVVATTTLALVFRTHRRMTR